MAIECAAKAIIIQLDPSVVDDEKRWNSLTRGHDLAWYIDQTPVGTSLSAQDRRLLARLGEAVRWRGRYPGDKKQLDIHMQASSDQDFAGWERLWELLCEHNKFKPWSPPPAGPL